MTTTTETDPYELLARVGASDAGFFRASTFGADAFADWLTSKGWMVVTVSNTTVNASFNGTMSAWKRCDDAAWRVDGQRRKLS